MELIKNQDGKIEFVTTTENRNVYSIEDIERTIGQIQSAFIEKQTELADIEADLHKWEQILTDAKKL